MRILCASGLAVAGLLALFDAAMAIVPLPDRQGAATVPGKGQRAAEDALIVSVLEHGTEQRLGGDVARTGGIAAHRAADLALIIRASAMSAGTEAPEASLAALAEISAMAVGDVPAPLIERALAGVIR